MIRSRRVLTCGAGALVVIALAAASLIYVNDWWLSGVMTVSIVAWLTGVLAAIYGQHSSRPLVIGAVVAGFLYVLLTVGPWFRAHVGPWLLTSQALVHVETKWLGRQPQVQQQLAFSGNPYSYVVTGSGVATWQQVMAGSNLVVANSPVTGGSTFLVVGHWLCGWLASALGAVTALWLSRKQSSPSSKEAAGVQP